MIHFRLVFAYGVKGQDSLFLNIVTSLSLYYWLKRLSVPHWVTLSKIVWADTYGSMYHWSICLSLRKYHSPLLYWSFIVLRSEGVSPPTLFFSKIVLVLLRPLHIHINFTVILLNLYPRKRLSGFLEQLHGVYRSICGESLKQHWDFQFISMVYL